MFFNEPNEIEFDYKSQTIWYKLYIFLYKKLSSQATARYFKIYIKGYILEGRAGMGRARFITKLYTPC